MADGGRLARCPDFLLSCPGLGFRFVAVASSRAGNFCTVWRVCFRTDASLVNGVKLLLDRCVPGVLAEPSRTAYAVSEGSVCDRSVLPAFSMFRGALQEKWSFGS